MSVVKSVTVDFEVEYWRFFLSLSQRRPPNVSSVKRQLVPL